MKILNYLKYNKNIKLHIFFSFLFLSSFSFLLIMDYYNGTFQIVQDSYCVLREGKVMNLKWFNKPNISLLDIIYFKRKDNIIGFFDDKDNLLIRFSIIVFNFFDKNPEMCFKI